MLDRESVLLQNDVVANAAAGFAIAPFGPSSSVRRDVTTLEERADYILDDCFFALGQAVGTRKTMDTSAVIWWRDHHRDKFVRVMRTCGDRWLIDRTRVTAMVRLLGERAVYYAGESPTIDRAAAMQATADVERVCTRRVNRRAERNEGTGDQPATRYAGYWCVL